MIADTLILTSDNDFLGLQDPMRSMVEAPFRLKHQAKEADKRNPVLLVDDTSCSCVNG